MDKAQTLQEFLDWLYDNNMAIADTYGGHIEQSLYSREEVIEQFLSSQSTTNL